MILYQLQAVCDSYRIQTYNLLIRSQMLYSVELRSLCFRFASAKVIRISCIGKRIANFFVFGLYFFGFVVFWQVRF